MALIMTDIAQSEQVLSNTKVPQASASRAPGYLFNPWVDFFCLGGGSLIVLGLIALLLPKGLPTTQQAALISVLMLIINQPHFAQSYQIFYRNFRAKVFGNAYAPSLRIRYLIAGLLVPAALLLFFAIALIDANPRLLAYGANLMFFLVGWHYVKQGYGILMVDSVKKAAMFPDRAKTILRVNGYACWMVAWLALNHALRTETYLGLTYFSFDFPDALYYAAIAVASLTTLATLGVFFHQWRVAGRLPWNGVIAYLTTLYLWVIFVRINPLILVVVPTFHSLQYQIVVWRYQWNASAEGSTTGTGRKFALFMGIALVLGYLGFVGLPQLFNTYVPYDHSVFGPSLFTFLFYIFINVHHYFLDNVMWRRENPDVRKYVFSRS